MNCKNCGAEIESDNHNRLCDECLEVEDVLELEEADKEATK